MHYVSLLLGQEEENKEEEKKPEQEEEPMLWEETFKSFHDPKPNGKCLT